MKKRVRDMAKRDGSVRAYTGAHSGAHPGARIPAVHKTIAKNRVAYHDYEIHDTYEAGIELVGVEVKGLRERACQLSDAFCIVRHGELYLVGLHIHPYSHGGVWNIDPLRRRRLLMHKKEIRAIDRKIQAKGIALVPLELYFNEGNRVKLRVGIGQGKKLFDKRASAAKRDMDREIQRVLKERSR